MAGISSHSDIRVVKRDLRARMKEIRRTMDPFQKQQKDAAILKKILALPEYQTARLVLTYVSTPIEVDTLQLIENAFQDGKRVAVPYCIPGKIDMVFCEIFSQKDLSPGTFGVLEPDPQIQPVLNDYPDSICILPGLSFDLKGYRLGYGKGYYDRFLSRYSGTKIGVCYSACLRAVLPHGRYDKMADALITEKFIKRFQPVQEAKPYPARSYRTSRKEGETHGRR
ncbi:MAG: 5-formyltetrahydrofolate cyclo-ligase [Candidatus Merdivicinus sp.]|jgi:5-formyltetrahydrofolate cyclo-ligase